MDVPAMASFDFSRRSDPMVQHPILTSIPATASISAVAGGGRRPNTKESRPGMLSPRRLHLTSAVTGAADVNVRDPCTYSAFREWSCRVELAALLALGLAVAG